MVLGDVPDHREVRLARPAYDHFCVLVNSSLNFCPSFLLPDRKQTHISPTVKNGVGESAPSATKGGSTHDGSDCWTIRLMVSSPITRKRCSAPGARYLGRSQLETAYLRKQLNNSMKELDLEQLEDSDYLLDILIQCENVLDTLDTYVARNWFEGEVVKGPIIRRHWVTFSLRYPHRKMPDPRAALRLLKHGVQVEFNTMKQSVAGKVNTPEHEPEEATDWLVTITIPRRLMDDTNEADLEYDEEVDIDDVEDAKDTGLDDESPYQEDEQLPSGDDMPMDQQQPPPQQQVPLPQQGQPPQR
jgi:hypothetical protein